MAEYGVREVKDIERELVMLLGYLVHKYCNDLAELDYTGFDNFMSKNPQLLRSDDPMKGTSYYKVIFGKTKLF